MIRAVREADMALPRDQAGRWPVSRWFQNSDSVGPRLASSTPTPSSVSYIRSVPASDLTAAFAAQYSACKGRGW